MVESKVILSKEVQNIDDFILNSIAQINGKLSYKESRRIEWTYHLDNQIISCETYFHEFQDSIEIISYANSKDESEIGSSKVLKILREKLETNTPIEKIEDDFVQIEETEKKKISFHPIHLILGILFVSCTWYALSDYIDISPQVYTTNAGYYGTYSKENLNRFMSYINEENQTGIYLMQNMGQVISIPKGEKAYLIKSDFGMVKIRLKNSPDEIWTVMEAISD